MAQSLNKIIVHIVFSTKHRQNFIDDAIKDELFNYLGGMFSEKMPMFSQKKGIFLAAKP